MATCTFCDIAGSAARAEIVLDEDEVVAFLDHRPLFPGHVLVIPRRHVATLADLPDGLIEPLFGAVRRLSVAVEQAMEAEGTFVAANNRVSQSVAHLHVHVVPRRRGDGLKGFFWPRHRYHDDSHRRQVGEAIRSALD